MKIITKFSGQIVRYAHVNVAISEQEGRADKLLIVDSILTSLFRAEDIRKMRLRETDSMTEITIQRRGGNMEFQLYILEITWTTTNHDT